MSMSIWVDGDACPNLIKPVLYRVADRRQLPMHFVANQSIAVPPSKYIRSIRVESGFDVADDYIVRHMQAGDLVITGDIPLAANVVGKHGYAISPRGEVYDQNNIGEKLALRNFMEEMRNNGQVSGGAAAMSPKDVQRFANALDRWLSARL